MHTVVTVVPNKAKKYRSFSVDNFFCMMAKYVLSFLILYFVPTDPTITIAALCKLVFCVHTFLFAKNKYIFSVEILPFPFESRI